jgi:hypothetical protein
MDETTKPAQEIFNVLNAVIGIGLALSPKLFGFTDDLALWHACVLGVGVALIATSALVMFVAWEEWLNASLGIWGMAAPWALSFTHDATATRVHVIAGASVLVVAAVELWLHHLDHQRQAIQRQSDERASYRRARVR